jgi:hypothetical protein
MNLVSWIASIIALLALASCASFVELKRGRYARARFASNVAMASSTLFLLDRHGDELRGHHSRSLRSFERRS